jgi:hypothetical protein
VNETCAGRLHSFLNSKLCAGAVVISQYKVAKTLKIINNYHCEKIKSSKRSIQVEICVSHLDRMTGEDTTKQILQHEQKLRRG